LAKSVDSSQSVQDVVASCYRWVGLVREAARRELRRLDPRSEVLFGLKPIDPSQSAQRPPCVDDVAVAVILCGRVVEAAVGPRPLLTRSQFVFSVYFRFSAISGRLT